MKIGSSTQRRLACLGDASRYRLVMALASGPRCVTDLAAAVGLSQSCTTRHLQALQAVGLIQRVRDGKRVMIRLSREEPDAGPMLDWVLERVRSAPAPGFGSRRASKEARRRAPAASTRSRADEREVGPGSRNGDDGEIPMVSLPQSASPEAGDEASPPGRIRRPDTIEDYLL